MTSSTNMSDSLKFSVVDLKGKSKREVVPVHAMQAHGGKGRIASLVLTLGTGRS